MPINYQSPQLRGAYNEPGGAQPQPLFQNFNRPPSGIVPSYPVLPPYQPTQGGFPVNVPQPLPLPFNAPVRGFNGGGGPDGPVDPGTPSAPSTPSTQPSRSGQIGPIDAAKAGGWIGAGLSMFSGIPGLALAGRAIGTGMEVNQANKTLGMMGEEANVSGWRAFAPSFLGGVPAHEQAIDTIEANKDMQKQARQEKEMGLDPFGGVSAQVEAEAAMGLNPFGGEGPPPEAPPEAFYGEDEGQEDKPQPRSVVTPIGPPPDDEPQPIDYSKLPLIDYIEDLNKRMQQLSVLGKVNLGKTHDMWGGLMEFDPWGGKMTAPPASPDVAGAAANAAATRGMWGGLMEFDPWGGRETRSGDSIGRGFGPGSSPGAAVGLGRSLSDVHGRDPTGPAPEPEGGHPGWG